MGRFSTGPSCVLYFSFPFYYLHIPSSLVRWNPNREDDNFFNQSVALYTEYYYIQIIIHRPFIPSPSKPRPLTFPSLAICTNAARSCLHILHIQGIRNKDPAPHILVPIRFLGCCPLDTLSLFFFFFFFFFFSSCDFSIRCPLSLRE
jgi:hypothetical protein